MYKRSACWLALILVPAALFAQQNDHPYFFSGDIKTNAIEINKRILFKEYPVPLLYTYAGNYALALQASNKGTALQELYKKADTAKLLQYRTTNAKDYILKQAANSRIIIINEAHHLPSHRVFTISLLKELRQMGFSYLSIEGLRRKKADSVNRRGYPLLDDVDYFDPQFGNLIREGLALQYKVSGHDTADKTVNHDPTLFAQRRDSLGAVNIKKLLDADKNARIVIHCGYSHGDECPLTDIGKRFALQVKELTGIDPFTVNQTQFMENDLAVIHPLVYLKKPGQPVAVKFEKGNFATGCVDVNICHPATKFTRGRPDWLLSKGKRYFSPARYLLKDKTYLIQAYRKGEPIENAIPVDVVEVEGRQSKTALILSPGAYHLLIREKGGGERVVPVTVKN
jgi:hypothetical protein